MSRRLSLLSFTLWLTLLHSLLAAAQTQPVDAEGHQWWQNAVFYEIYPRSFADSNNDGVGDLNGITSKMDYLKRPRRRRHLDHALLSLAAGRFRLRRFRLRKHRSRCTARSPTSISMVADGKQHGIRIIMDFVLNHTSDQHPWFIDSQSSRTTRSIATGTSGATERAWPAVRITGSRYSAARRGSSIRSTNSSIITFSIAQQPDLNWRNPAVKDAMFDVTRWWYDRGVAGFRLDAVDTLFEDPALHDNPVLPGKNAQGDSNMENKNNTNFPEVHTELQKMRKVADESGAVLIGETWTSTAAELDRYYGQNGNELQMPMDFMFMMVDKLSPREYRRQIAAVESAHGWPVFVINNHDRERSYNRYGDGKHNDEIAKLMAAFYLTLRGTPIMYYGEEIGMRNNDPKRREDVKDPIGRTGWPKEKGRDGERTPMQWNSEPNAGFSTRKPWLPVPASYRTHNVETESNDPNSILNLYKEVLELPAGLSGTFSRRLARQ